MDVMVRAYSDADLAACRSLWADLTQHHRALYRDPTIGGENPGEAFDDHLQHPNLVAVWVAEAQGTVLGLCGLLVAGDEGEVEPIVVHPDHRRGGIGHRLLERAIAEARQHGLRYVNVRPVARNTEALRFFSAGGFGLLGRFELSLALTAEAGAKLDEPITIDGQSFLR
jgi:N-acetylglutamate synthase-like GNAT family acetyltransferase